MTVGKCIFGYDESKANNLCAVDGGAVIFCLFDVAGYFAVFEF